MIKKLLTAFAVTAGLCLPVKALATCSNYTTYISGQTLTAASLNSLQTTFSDCTNNVLNGDTFTGNMLWNGGVDILMYSDTTTTLKASIDGATGASILGLTQEGQMTNCGVTVSGSTITIAGYDGTALSATNPCVVAIRSSTAGQLSLAYFTANISTTFGAASDTDGNLFGITDANWSNTMPMFLGVVNGNTTPYWVMSRLPYVQTGAAATALCQEGDTDCDAQLDMLAMTTGLTLANEVDKPVTQVGWFDATYATTGGAWTFAVTGKNGFNDNYKSVRFSYPLAHGGAGTTSYVHANSGTAPVFTTNLYQYEIDSSGRIKIETYIDGDGGTDGAGAVASRLSIPFSYADGTLPSILRAVGYTEGAATLSANALYALQTENLTYVTLYYLNASAVPTAITNEMYPNGGRQIRFITEYNAIAN